MRRACLAPPHRAKPPPVAFQTRENTTLGDKLWRQPRPNSSTSWAGLWHLALRSDEMKQLQAPDPDILVDLVEWRKCYQGAR